MVVIRPRVLRFKGGLNRISTIYELNALKIRVCLNTYFNFLFTENVLKL